MSDELADALAGGGRFIKWKDIGQRVVVSGTVTGVKMRQTRKLKLQGGVYIDEGPAIWDDGSPRMEAIIGLSTTLREDADDDGSRSLSINMWSGQKRALGEACRKAGVTRPQQGDGFSAVWVSGGGDPGDPRVFAYQIIPGTPDPVDPFAGQTPKWQGPKATTAADPGDTWRGVPAQPPAPPAPPSAPTEQAAIDLLNSVFGARPLRTVGPTPAEPPF